MGRFMKFRADSLFTGSEMLSGKDHVLVLNERETVEGIVKKEDAGEDILELVGTLCPGFVNSHCHLELSHLRNSIAQNTGMAQFLLEVMSRREEKEEVKLQAMKDAEIEMMDGGIVAVGDICNTTDSFAVKASSPLQYYNFMEVAGFVPATANSRFNQAFDLYTQCRLFTNACSLSPHAPYSVSPELFELIFSLRQKVVTMHNQESQAETEFFISKSGPLLKIYEQLDIDLSFFTPSGKSSLQSVAHHFRNMDSLLLVHNCFTGKEDIVGRLTNSVHFCICPNANRYIGNPLPDLPLLLSNGLNICLGTDSLASNHRLSIWNEIQTIQKQFPQIPLATLLQWATRNGAIALKMDNEVGSFEKGKKPGVVLIGNDNGVKRML
jgi:aminodeoxyfutalosine deaminase